MIGTVLLGGEITMDEQMKEMDILSINFTASVETDPLLSNVPDKINIVSGHQKSASVLPPDSTLLASSEKCPIHAYRLNTAPIYAFQGHPELTGPQIKARVSPYKEKYFKTEEDYLRFVDSSLDTRQSNMLLSQFIAKVKNGMLI
jgi:GMP synthase (glutamine-hydrolysing)